MMITSIYRTENKHLGTALGVGCIALTAVDFYPVNTLYRIQSLESDLSKFHSESANRKPYVSLPLSPGNAMMRFGRDQGPTADGGMLSLSVYHSLPIFRFDFFLVTEL